MRSFVVAVEVVQGVASPAHDAVELLEIEHAISVTIGFLQHLLEFVIGDLLSNFPGDALEVFEGDFVEVVLIEQLEDLEDFLLGVPGALSGGRTTMREVITPENSLKLSPSFSSFPS